MAESEQLDVICCSLESWDDVWRRNQHLAAGLLRLRPGMRLLFVEPAVDVAWSLRNGRWPRMSKLRAVGASGRLWAMAPRKWLPRRVWPGVDRALFDQVLSTSRRLGFARPLLWVNDSVYAPLLGRTGWPSVYDVTDDWLLAQGPPAGLELERRNDAVMLERASEVVVCSPALASSRGRDRDVHLVPNGVDVDHLRGPTSRPSDLPDGRIVLYQGTLSAGRLDLGLCAQLSRALASRATLVFVGPNALTHKETSAVEARGALVLGPRPYAELPAYLQHADVLVVPHQVTPFTDSLDPIKAREFLAVGRPVVSTPVAGFRDVGPPVVVAGSDTFVGAVLTVLDGPRLPPGPGGPVAPLPTWADRASEFLAVIDSAVAGGAPD